MVPFLDLQRLHKPLLAKFQEALSSITNRSAFINGPEVQQFEDNFAEWVGSDFCVGLSNGTDAEVIGLQAIGLKRGDKVILPAMTFVATIEAVVFAGGTPVLVDVDDSGLIDLNLVEKELKNGAKFIFPVHLFGNLVNPNDLLLLKNKYGCTIFEDACQAHGAHFGKFKAGNIGAASAFSFYPGKNLGALGDGGALCTSDEKIAEKARALREHGQTSKNVFEYVGHTARLDTLQAAFLGIKLPAMDGWNSERIRIASRYIEAFHDVDGIRLQSKSIDGSHVFHLFVVLSEKRQELCAALSSKNIGWGMHYPISLNKISCYWRQPQESFPKAELYASQGLSLPIFPGMTDDEVLAVIATVSEAMK